MKIVSLKNLSFPKNRDIQLMVVNPVDITIESIEYVTGSNPRSFS